MSPSEIRKQVVGQLNKTFKAMMSPEWDYALDDLPPAEVTKAAKALLNVQRARLKIGNAQLAEIRDALKENEGALIEGKSRLEKTLKNLDDAKKILEATSAFLKIVARVAAFAV